MRLLEKLYAQNDWTQVAETLGTGPESLGMLSLPHYLEQKDILESFLSAHPVELEREPLAENLWASGLTADVWATDVGGNLYGIIVLPDGIWISSGA